MGFMPGFILGYPAAEGYDLWHIMWPFVAGLSSPLGGNLKLGQNSHGEQKVCQMTQSVC